MAFTLDASRPLSLEMRRISQEQFDYALACLEQTETGDEERTVHEFRKATKKLRAVLRLLSKILPREQRARWTSSLRDAALALSRRRERVVLEELLERAYDSVAPALSRAARTGISESLLAPLPSGARTDLEPQSLLRSSVTLTDISHELQQALPDELDPAILTDALVRSYRRGRKALEVWRDRRTLERLHDFRKRVKTHLYQMRLMAGLSKKSIRRDSLALEQLAELLGSCHDLMQLKAVLEAARTTWSAPVQPSGLLNWVEVQLDALQRQARHQALRLYRASPRHWQRRLVARAHTETKMPAPAR